MQVGRRGIAAPPSFSLERPQSPLAEYEAQVNAKAPGAPVTLTVTRIQQSAGGPPPPPPVTAIVTAQALLPAVTASGQPLAEAIWRERRHELAMEQHRFFDLRRQGPQQAQQALQAHGKTFKTGCHELFPIPASEVAISGLQQNAGYPCP